MYFGVFAAATEKHECSKAFCSHRAARRVSIASSVLWQIKKYGDFVDVLTPKAIPQHAIIHAPLNELITSHFFSVRTRRERDHAIHMCLQGTRSSLAHCSSPTVIHYRESIVKITTCVRVYVCVSPVALAFKTARGHEGSPPKTIVPPLHAFGFLSRLGFNNPASRAFRDGTRKQRLVYFAVIRTPELSSTGTVVSPCKPPGRSGARG